MANKNPIGFSGRTFKATKKAHVKKEIINAIESSSSLRKEIAKVFQQANRRIQNIEKNGVVSPAVVALPVNSLYQASASYLDDHREILFPSFYNDNRPTTQPAGMGGDDSMALRCYIVSGDNYQEVQLDTSRILTNADKAVYVSPYLIDINNNLYFLMCVNNKTHNEPYAGEISTFKLVKVQLSSI